MSEIATPVRSGHEREMTLMVPGLLETNDRIPAPLNRMLARADHSQVSSTGAEARLFELFGYIPETGHDLPVAAVSRVADLGVIDNDWWIRADPVYLEARRDSLILKAGVGLSKSETEQLAAELNESLALDGWLLRAPGPERWYLKPQSETVITTTPLTEADGRDVHDLLPQGPDQQVWRSRLTELQILLHTSSVNAEREARGALPANSVWFWGGGRLPRLPDGSWEAVFTRDALTLGLARLSGARVWPLPASGAELPKAAGIGHSLVVLSPISPEMLQQICEQWLEPLIEAVHRNEINSLTLVGDRGPRFQYIRHHRWRFWRRGRLPSAWREQAA